MRSKSKLRFLAVTACILAFQNTEAIDLPDMGDPSGAVLSPQKARELGGAFFREIRRRNRIVNSPETQDYIDALGKHLASYSTDRSRSFTFFLVDDPTINAFAAPGGYIGVHTGLVLNSRTESELAGVLAHEIAHVTQHHMARTFERAGKLSIPVAVAMLGAILIGSQDPEAGQAAFAAVAAASAQHQIDFTRANEKEADRVGIRLLARAGFDPKGMPGFFERLQIANRLTDPKNFPEFLRTHPVTVSRIADSRNRVEQYPPTQYKDSSAYHLTRARLLVAGAGDSAGAVDYFEALLRSGEYYHEDVARYGYALALTEAGEFGKAQIQVAHLLRSNPDEIAYQMAAARVALADERTTTGLSIYKRQLERHPSNRAIMVAYAEALLHTKQPQRARQILRKYAKQYDPDVLYYTLVSQAEGQGGSLVESHMALSEVYYLSGDTERAKEQLEIAQRGQPITNYQRQRITSRLEKLQEELDEKKKL